MEPVLDMTKRHHRFFEEMTRIPHGSFHEEAYSRYLEEFARTRGLKYVRDEKNNVIIYKPASPGYERHPPVALQAHMDMVWVKDEGWEHDFERDPLKLYIEDGYLMASHTTLGADNGTGVCYILAVLDDPDAKHPPLEGIFTVQEEVGMFGAIALDKSLIHASRFISLDCGGGDSIYISSMGGCRYQFRRELRQEPAAGRAWRLSVNGLRGDYSTSYFHGAENAVRLCAEALLAMEREVPLRLAGLEGGNDGKKVANTCQATFTADGPVDAVFLKASARLKKETESGEPACVFDLSPCQVAERLVASDSRAVLDLLCLLPCGLVSKSVLHEGIMAASVNWTEAGITESGFQLTCMLRGESDCKLDQMALRAEVLGRLLGFKTAVSDSIPAWEFKENSALCAALNKVFRRRFGRDIGKVPVQGGLECSIFSQIRPDMDMIAMGPLGENPHTTRERLQLASFDDMFDVFTELLAEL